MIHTAIGIDLGGSFIKYGLITEDGNMLYNAETPTPKSSRESVVEALLQCVRDVADSVSGPEADCIGIGSPGIADHKRGIVKGGAFQLPDWENVALGKIMRDEFGLPAFVDNDCNLMGLGEFRFGKHPKAQNIIFLTIGTGIGGAIILNGSLFRGSRDAGGELGAFPFTWGQEEGTWEDFASAGALVRTYQQKTDADGEVPGKGINGRIVFERAASGDALAKKVIEEHIDLVGRGIGGYINVFNPDQIIIGGGVSESGDDYIRAVEEAGFKHALKECCEGVGVRGASLGNKAGMLGAAFFALSENKDKSAGI